MKKPARATKVVARNHALANGNGSQPKGRGFPFTAVSWAVVGISGITVALCMAATATDVLQGNVRVEKSQSAAGSSSRSLQGLVKSAKAVSGKTDNLVDKYGAAASSPTVAAAIRKAAAGTGNKNVDRASGAKAAADKYEALEHGHPLPGTNPMQLIMHGFVPPGMPAQQAAMLYNSLPSNVKRPHVPEPGTPEWIAVMSREPVDPESGLPFSLKEQQIQAANYRIAEERTRGRFGPVYVPPLHGDHNAARAASKMADGIARKSDNQMSLISPQYSYDGGNGPASIREMTDSSGNVVSQYGYDPFGRQTRIGGTGPDADFGYAGYYVHARSGLNLAVHRAYNPNLGRWLNRDPIQDPTFRMMPQTPESNNPMVRSQLASSGGTHPSRELNPYVYVNNNPIRFSDPSGLMSNLVTIPLPLPSPPVKKDPTPPEDPDEEWHACETLCAKYLGTPAYDECMYYCLGIPKSCSK